jgi:hypothetical protein
MTASVELMRCGDVAVTTNGVAALLPREILSRQSCWQKVEMVK